MIYKFFYFIGHDVTASWVARNILANTGKMLHKKPGFFTCE
ncbi:hypothetical protein BN1221_03024 [Brenneria goodwinii]|uniref:Uncharacterized protein n=1 Tax=Brenneria goodwinii TaxID=1109412 RepID=A0A0G4JXC2_9GAMM|nr:hypothetical protein BN1221_03024 [Brenneria goodwinii]